MCAKYKAAGVRNISFIALQKGFIAHLAQELTFFSFLQTNYRQLRLSRRHFKKRTRYQPPTIAWYSGGKA